MSSTGGGSQDVSISASRASRARAGLAIGAITLVALALRLAAMDESFFGDELFTYEISTRHSLHAVIDGVRSGLEITPPLFFVVAWLFQHLGDPFVWLRLPSLLAGVATVPLVYLLGLRTVGRRAALLGAGLYALSPIAIFYATEARAYALTTLLVLLSTLALLRAIDTDDWRWWAAFGLLETAAMYSHYTSIFVLGTQAVWALVTERRHLRTMLIVHAVAALAYAPWVPWFLDDLHAPPQQVMAKLAPFTLHNVVDYLGRLVDGGPFAPLHRLPGSTARWALAAAALIGLAGLAVRDRANTVRWTRRSALVVLLGLAAPVGAGVASAAGGELFITRNLLTSLPALALAFAALLVRLPRPARALAVTLAVAAIGWGALGTFDTVNQRPAFKQVASFVSDQARPGDVVLELNLFRPPPGQALAVQLDPQIPLFRLNKEAKAIATARAGGGRIFYVHSEVGRRSGLRPLEVERSYREADRRTWPGLSEMTVVVYEPR